MQNPAPLPTPTPTPLPTPRPVGAPQPGRPRRIRVTGCQGCLLLAAIPVFFLLVAVVAALVSTPEADGSVILSGGTETRMVPFGCQNLIGDVIIPLRDEDPREGFALEDRALVLRDTRQDLVIPSGPVPDAALSLSYRDERRLEHPLTCPQMANTLTRGTTRFRILPQESERRRRPEWSGALAATCTVPDGRAVEVAVTLDDCR